MTAEDTLSAIDATLNGYYDRDVMVSDDAMRWAPDEPSEDHSLRKVSTTTSDTHAQVHYWCTCGERATGIWPLTGDLVADRDRAEHYASIWHRSHVMGATGEVPMDLVVIDPGLPADDDLTYVENTTSREQEGQ